MGSLILFDFDELLALTQKLCEQHMTPILQKYLDPNATYPLEEFHELCQQLYRQHGSAIHGWAKLNGHEKEWVMEMQAHTNREVGDVIRPFVAPDTAINRGLETLYDKGHTMAVVTHSHREYTLPFITHLHMQHIFPPVRLFDVVAMEGRSKQEDAAYAGVEQALAEFGPFEHKIMLDDSSLNLLVPCQRGYITYLVREEPPEPGHNNAVDHHFKLTSQALDHLNSYL